MARDDRFKKVQEAGADFLETARSRAEEFLRELAKAGDSTQGRAQGAVDDLVEGSRRGTEQILSTIRTEVSAQLGLLGLATKADLADLEARLSSASKPAPARKAAAPRKAGTARQGSPRKAAAKASVSARKTTTSKTAASKSAATKRVSATKSAAKATTGGTAKRAAAKKVAG